MTIQMMATYKRPHGLNVRESPDPNAKVVRVMREGDSEECLEVSEGWAKLADGFVNAKYVYVSLGESASAAAEEFEALAEDAPADEAEAAPADEAAPTDEAAPADEDDEAAELRKMKNPELYDLAVKSGIKVKKGANKDALIAAILADE